MQNLFLVAMGGAVGALLRYGLAGGIYRLVGTGFPWGTLAVNVTGCVLIGVCFHLFERGAITPEMRLFLMVGVLGGYTTFSSFGLETMELWRAGHAAAALLNVALSNGLGLAGVWAGFAGARSLGL